MRWCFFGSWQDGVLVRSPAVASAMAEASDREMFGLCAQTLEEFIVEFSFVGVGCAIVSGQLFSLVCCVSILHVCVSVSRCILFAYEYALFP
jgi:hypothetical protein